MTEPILIECMCGECGEDCPELVEDGEMECVACRHGQHVEVET